MSKSYEKSPVIPGRVKQSVYSGGTADKLGTVLVRPSVSAPQNRAQGFVSVS